MRFRVVSAVALLTAVPGLSQALGLGDETVRSFLNAPLNAEIELFATPEELSSVRVQLASRDDFVRHGLDYPGFLTGIQVRVERLSDGRNVLRLTSGPAVVEPFVVLLLDVRTNGSRLLREYTLLLDPPTFQSGQTAAPPVAAPTTGDAPGNVIRPAPPAATLPPPSVSQPVAPERPVAPPEPTSSAAGGSYTVQRGDTLSSIANREYGEGPSRQAMIAIFRANPEAFAGNINQLRAGANLALPDQEAVASVSRAEASAEVRSQMSSWLASTTPAPEDAEARLRLVPPGETAGTGGTSPAPAVTPPGPAATPPAPVPDRPVTVENPDLARLQQGQTPPPAQAPDIEAPAPVEGEGEVDLADLGVTEPATTEPAAPARPVREPAPAADAAAEEGGGLLALLKDYWLFGVGGLAVVLALLGLVAVRRRREASAAFAPIAPSLDDFDIPGGRDTSADTFPLRKPTDGRDSNIVVEESGVSERTAVGRRETRTVELDEAAGGTMGSMALEQGDPLAEADFHMAYGLYDQAADLVKAALKREPARRDLKLKLLEVYFVWGNKDQFLQTARDLARTRETAAPGEWEKVVIMGKQLAPEDVLFHQSGAAAQTSVDLNLEGGQNLVDFNLQDIGGTGEHAEIDMNLGGGTDTNLKLSESGLDFMFDDPSRGDDRAPTATTRQMAQPGLDAINAPTVEQPALDNIEDTLAGKLDARRPFTGSPDQTAELALDDLGLDLGKLEATGTGMMPHTDEEESPGDAPTLVAGLDATSRELLAAADGTARTELLPLTDLDLSGGNSALDIDFGVGDTGKSPTLDGGGLDLDVGAPEYVAGGDYQKTQRIDPTVLDPSATARDLEPVTMSEVGTKLDLARAYMDMGDPDGARSILSEVVQEGSESQRQEAKRLLDSIPG